MIIPNKFNGFHNGIRRCFGGAGGGGGGGDVTGMNFGNTNTGGYNSSGVNNMQGVNPATTRPYAGSDQFFQPVYNSQYQNYARPATQFNVSSYGTQPSNSPAFNSGMSRGAINQNLNNFYNTNYRDNPQGASMGSTLDFMRQNGINRDDFQSWGGVNNYGPQMSMPQMQSPFNPYSNSSGQGGVLTPYSGGRPTDVTGGDYMGGKGTGMPFAQRMGQLGIPAGLDDTMTPDIMAANAANQQKNAASRANTAANPASISDLSKRLGLMGGYGGNTSPQGMLTNRLEQPQGMQKNNDALVAANRPPTFSDYGSDYLPRPSGYNTGAPVNFNSKIDSFGQPYAGRGSLGNDMREAGPMGGDMSVGATAPSGMDQLAVMPPSGGFDTNGPNVNSPYFAGVGAMPPMEESSVGSVGYAAPTTGGGITTFGGMGAPMGMMPQQGGFLPQMQTPFSYQHPLLGNGPKPAAQPETRLAGSGISRRPARRAEGGIASLMGNRG